MLTQDHRVSSGAAAGPRRSPRLLAGLAIVVVAVAAGALLVQRGPKATPPASEGTTSCAYSSNSIAWLNQLSATVGRPVNCAVVYNDVATTWETLMQPWFISGNGNDFRWDRWVAASRDRQLVIGQSLIPADAPADWRARGAAGDYDAEFRLLGERLVAAGLGRSIIRLAHEANGDWFLDNVGVNATQWTQWATYWARVAGILHNIPGAHFELDLTVSSGPRAIPLAQWYPGDDAVDIIGVDQYDVAPTWVAKSAQARWTYQMTQPGGFDTVAAFAALHHKPLSVPEWGVTDSANYGAGDDPYYVAHMLGIFASYHVRYESVWDKRGTSSELVRNPQSLKVYRAAG
jgi:Glycosyl hydrolase family 26